MFAILLPKILENPKLLLSYYEVLYTIVFIFLIKHLGVAQQPIALGYYLPEDVKYNPNIPAPKPVLGFEVGEMHGEHRQMVAYLKALEEASPRITGQTYEKGVVQLQ